VKPYAKVRKEHKAKMIKKDALILKEKEQLIGKKGENLDEKIDFKQLLEQIGKEKLRNEFPPEDMTINLVD